MPIVVFGCRDFIRNRRFGASYSFRIADYPVLGRATVQSRAEMRANELSGKIKRHGRICGALRRLCLVSVRLDSHTT